jgi:transcriptional regulator with XRE-family HTH domain
MPARATSIAAVSAEPLPPRRRAPAIDLGARVRAEREAAGVSVRGLAKRLGVSPSLVSQIERGLAQPSVGTLWAIVTELGLSLDALFAAESDDAERPARVQRAAERRAIELEGGVRWERLTAAPDADADFAFVTYPPGGDSHADEPPATHRGKEYGFLVSGRLAIEIGDEVLELGPGDSIVFGSETPHRFRAVGDEPAHAVWLNLTR